MKLPSFISRLLPGAQAKSVTFMGTEWFSLGGAESTEASLLGSNKEWVYVAVDKIGHSVAGTRFKVMRFQKTGDDQEVFEGPLVEFLDSPAAGLTGRDFLYLTTVYKELTGNAFWEKDGRNKLSPLIPTQVQPIVVKGELVGYRYSDGTKQRVLKLDAVLHDRYIDPQRPYWGVGKLAKIARWVDTSSFANEFLKRFFTQGASFGGFIETEEESAERIKLIKVGLANDHVGVANAHKMGVLPKGAKFTPAGTTMKDMEMGATDDRYRDKILSGFGVPKTLVGLTTDVNRASIEGSEYIYAKWTIKPIVDDLIDFLNTQVLPLLDDSGKFYFAYDDFIPRNEELDVKERQASLANQGWKTHNEVRAETGLPPVEGGDVIYANPMMLPLGEKPPTPDAPANDNDKAKKAIPPRARRDVKLDRLVDGFLNKAQEIITKAFDPDAEAHKKFVARVDDYEKYIAERVKDFNNKQQRELLIKLNRITKAIYKNDLFDMDFEVGVLVDFITPILGQLLTEQAIEEYKAQKFPGTFSGGSPSIARIVANAAKRLARSYNDTTAEQLKETLNEGLAAGDNISQLATRVQDVYLHADRVRALMVARTEAFYIANEGSKEAYRQSGVVKSIRWYTAEDERVCEFCTLEHGKVIGITESFYPKGATVNGRDGGTLSTDYRAITVPPLHVQCRCFIRPETISIE